MPEVIHAQRVKVSKSALRNREKAVVVHKEDDQLVIASLTEWLKREKVKKGRRS